MIGDEFKPESWEEVARADQLRLLAKELGYTWDETKRRWRKEDR